MTRRMLGTKELAGTRDIFFFQNIYTSFIVKEASYSLGTKSTLPKGKWPGHEAGHPYLVPSLRMHEAIPPFPHKVLAFT
jgi:hypothetical protein